MPNRSHAYKIITCLIGLIVFTIPVISQLYYTSGGEISYKFLREEVIGDNAFYRYQVSVKLYKECDDNTSNFPFSVSLAFFVNSSQTNFPLSKTVNNIPFTSTSLGYHFYNACANNNHPLCYNIAVYTTEVDLPTIPFGYIVAYQNDRRKENGFNNADTHNSLKASGGIMGFTYVTYIPGSNVALSGPYSSSPVFKKDYPLIICSGNYFRYDFSADDPDGDSLSYYFAPAYQGYDYTTPNGVADHPPFKTLHYFAPYSGTQPLGSGVTIDSQSGMISGTAPNAPGKYIVVVLVNKYRNGQLIGKHRKEIQFVLDNCTWPTAQIDSTYKNCKGRTIHFTNYSTGSINSYYWDFGDPTTNADTSNLREPFYTYPAPGIYEAKLILNKNTLACKDSAFCTVIVDSGMVANFIYQRTQGTCNQAIYDFTNTSTQSSHPINSWNWNFGETTSFTDVSNLQNPTYNYTNEGSKNVRLIVGNDIGCTDTLFRTINIYKTLLHAPDDTTICYIDTIRLNSNTGHAGTYLWSPNYNINSLTVPDPLVSPNITTLYHVTFTDSSGCVANDSVKVFVRNSVNIRLANNDTTICKGDSFDAIVLHDGTSVTWQPVNDVILENLTGSLAAIHPMNTTIVVATANFGSCKTSDSMIVKVVPLPNVMVSNDTSICIGAPIYLQASGGASYSWTPAELLSNANIPNPVSHPVHNTIYTVSVTDTLGCPKPVKASVRVNSFRGLFAKAEKDTMIVEGESIQLTGSGGQYYQWSPPDYLSSAFIANPTAKPYGDIMYVLKITNDNNCVDYDSVRVRAFKDADIYVPTAFTPNSDGKNDLFKVYPVGFDMGYLEIYDRWGNKIFSTTDYTRGWNGTYKGITLNTGTFVWILKGKNKKTGETIIKKGTVTLIR